MEKVLTEVEVMERLRAVMKQIYREYPGTPEHRLALLEGSVTMSATLYMGDIVPANKTAVTPVTDLVEKMQDLMDEYKLNYVRKLREQPTTAPSPERP